MSAWTLLDRALAEAAFNDDGLLALLTRDERDVLFLSLRAFHVDADGLIYHWSDAEIAAHPHLAGLCPEQVESIRREALGKLGRVAAGTAS